MSVNAVPLDDDLIVTRLPLIPFAEKLLTVCVEPAAKIVPVAPPLLLICRLLNVLLPLMLMLSAATATLPYENPAPLKIILPPSSDRYDAPALMVKPVEALAFHDTPDPNPDQVPDPIFNTLVSVPDVENPFVDDPRKVTSLPFASKVPETSDSVFNDMDDDRDTVLVDLIVTATSAITLT